MLYTEREREGALLGVIHREGEGGSLAGVEAFVTLEYVQLMKC